MEISTILDVPDRKAWRAWLRENHRQETDVWLVYYRKDSGKPRLSYSDAVEEALCFGWIDSTAKALDKERFVQRFSVRRPGSPYSQINKERLRRLIERGQVRKEVLATLGNILDEEFTIPRDILAALKKNQEAWTNFQRYSAPYQRIRIAYIDGARKRPEEFQKRLKHFLSMTEKNKQFGFGIEAFF